MDDINLELLYDEIFEQKPREIIVISEKENIQKTVTSGKIDTNSEIIVRKALENNFPITKLKEIDLEKNKEFTL